MAFWHRLESCLRNNIRQLWGHWRHSPSNSSLPSWIPAGQLKTPTSSLSCSRYGYDKVSREDRFRLVQLQTVPPVDLNLHLSALVLGLESFGVENALVRSQTPILAVVDAEKRPIIRVIGLWERYKSSLWPWRARFLPCKMSIFWGWCQKLSEYFVLNEDKTFNQMYYLDRHMNFDCSEKLMWLERTAADSNETRHLKFGWLRKAFQVTWADCFCIQLQKQHYGLYLSFML